MLQTYRATSQTAYGIVVGILGGIAEEYIGLGELDFLTARGVAVVVGRHLEIFCEKFGFGVQARRGPGTFFVLSAKSLAGEGLIGIFLGSGQLPTSESGPLNSCYTATQFTSSKKSILVIGTRKCKKNPLH